MKKIQRNIFGAYPHNEKVADEELPKNMIVSVWKVIKVLTDKGW